MRRISKNTRSFVEGVPNKVDRNAIESVRTEKVVVQARRYKLITPLFGGGSETKKADAVQTIRVPEVRGQLRFWWRAIRGVGGLDEMRRREGEIFGTAGTETNPSAVKIIVKDVDRGIEIQSPKDDPNVPKYAAFPLENQDILRKNVQFTLEITFPMEFVKEIEAALWAWETFGGVGGRTRRGFGSIQLLSVNGQPTSAPASKALKDHIEAGLNEHLAAGNWDVEIPHPHLSPAHENFAFSAPSLAANADNVTKVWKAMIEKLQAFRQSPRTTTVYKGESHWPEPDAIRRKTTSAKINPSDSRSKDRTPSHAVGNKFPRGQLGLPIIFKFKNQDVDNGDPPLQTLQGANRDEERLSSPLILRPIICSDGAVGVGLALETPRSPLGGVILKNHPGLVETTLEKEDVASIQPMKNASTTETDVVKSFLLYLEKNL